METPGKPTLEELNALKSMEGYFVALIKEMPYTAEDFINFEYINFEMIDYKQKNPWVATGYIKEKDLTLDVRAKTRNEAIMKLKKEIQWSIKSLPPADK